MRAIVAFLALPALAACGQTGALYLPDESAETPVEIRGPAPPPVASPQPEDEKDEKKEEKTGEPPGR
jgi:predicted small lipoprotein YifL